MHSGFSHTTCLPALAASIVIWAWRLDRVAHGDADAGVGRAIVQIPPAAEPHQTFHKRCARGVLSGPLVTLGWLDERAVRPCNQLRRITRIKQRLPGRVRA